MAQHMLTAMDSTTTRVPSRCHSHARGIDRSNSARAPAARAAARQCGPASSAPPPPLGAGAAAEGAQAGWGQA